MMMTMKTSIYSYALTFARGRNWYDTSATTWAAESVHFEEVPLFDA